MADTVTQKDTKEGGGPSPHIREEGRRASGKRPHAVWSRLCIPTRTHTHTHTHTCRLLAFPDSQVLSGHSRVFQSPCQCPSYSAVRFKFSFRFSLWEKKKKGSSLKRCKWLKPHIHMGLSKQPQLIFWIKESKESLASGLSQGQTHSPSTTIPRWVQFDGGACGQYFSTDVSI